MSDKPHLLVPGAVLPREAGAPRPPPGPNLARLLRELVPAERLEAGPDSPCLPDEMAIAHAIGLPGEPGALPWAALETGTFGAPCAWVYPCHWRVGADHILVTPPDDLALDEASSRALMAAVAPYFAEDGLTLRYLPATPGAWLALGEPLRRLRTVSLAKAVGRRLDPAFLGAGTAEGALLRRLQNEMQMLLYTLPLNEAREREGRLPVNSFWMGGAGELAQPLPPVRQVLVEHRLSAAAARGDAQAHAQAWQEVDADSCAGLLTQLREGQSVRLTLCGFEAAQAWESPPAGWWPRLRRTWAVGGSAALLDTL